MARSYTGNPRQRDQAADTACVTPGSCGNAAPAGGVRERSFPARQPGQLRPGSAHSVTVRTADGRLTFLQAIGSRRKDAIAAGLPALFAGYLITDGYTGYQHLLGRLAGIQQCAPITPTPSLCRYGDAGAGRRGWAGWRYRHNLARCGVTLFSPTSGENSDTGPCPAGSTSPTWTPR